LLKTVLSSCNPSTLCMCVFLQVKDEIPPELNDIHIDKVQQAVRQVHHDINGLDCVGLGQSIHGKSMQGIDTFIYIYLQFALMFVHMRICRKQLPVDVAGSLMKHI